MRLLLLAAVVLVQQTAPKAGSPTARPEFEVATVKPSPPDERGGFIRPLPGGQTYVAKNVPVRLIIRLMYHLTNQQVTGGPNWISSDRWDIEAKSDHPTNVDELHIMFQNLLVDRFHLQFHHETKQMPVYALTVDKSGSKMKVSESSQAYEIPIQPAGNGKLAGVRVPMSYLTWFVAGLPMIDRPVLDNTGLTGFYDFTFEFRPPRPPGADGGDTSNDDPDFFTALREQLGLRLEPSKGPVDVMVIDHIEKPGEN